VALPFKFFSPPSRQCLGNPGVFALTVKMPEASMDKDTNTASRHNDVRIARQIAAVRAERYPIACSNWRTASSGCVFLARIRDINPLRCWGLKKSKRERLLKGGGKVEAKRFDFFKKL
jgi:hypothetical protein